MKDTLHSKSSPKRKFPAINKIKKLANAPNSGVGGGLERPKSNGEARFNQTSVTSLMRLDESKIAENLNNFGNRPTVIDNNDIEGEHPG